MKHGPAAIAHLLASHFLPVGAGSPLLADEFEKFLTYREAALLGAIQERTKDQHRAEQKDAEDRRRAEELAALKGEFAHLSREALKLNSETFTEQAVQTLRGTYACSG